MTSIDDALRRLQDRDLCQQTQANLDADSPEGPRDEEVPQFLGRLVVIQEDGSIERPFDTEEALDGIGLNCDTAADSDNAVGDPVPGDARPVLLELNPPDVRQAGDDDAAPNGQSGRTACAFEVTLVDELSRPSIAEHYGLLWSRIQKDLAAGQLGTAALVGCEPGEHVTNVIARLAAMLAMSRQNVLLVDADTLWQRLTRTFELEGQPGLADVCLNRCSWNDVILPTTVAGFELLPAGTGRVGGESLSESTGRLLALLDAWKGHFDLVLVDGGDLQSGLAAVVARMCQAVYVVVRLGRTPRRLAMKALQRLKAEGLAPRGCIATNANAMTVFPEA